LQFDAKFADALREASNLPWRAVHQGDAFEFRIHGLAPPTGISISLRIRANSIVAEMKPDRMFEPAAQALIREAARALEHEEIEAEFSDVNGISIRRSLDDQTLSRLMAILPEDSSETVNVEVAMLLLAVLGETVLRSDVFESDGLNKETDDPTHSDTEIGLPEGAVIRVLTNRYERSPRNRALAILIHGTTCLGCGLQMGDRYGAIAADHIHIHHTTPIHQMGAEYVCNPKTDLVPLCPNCHFVCHLRNPPLGVSELRQLVDHESK